MSEKDEKKSVTWEFYELCYAWRKVIALSVLVLAVLATVLAFILPVKYEGQATVLPSQKSAMLSMLGTGMSSTVSSLARQFGSLVGGGEGQIGVGFNYLAILNSRDAMERVVKKFDLMKVYSIGDSSMDKTIKELRSNSDFELDKFGQVVVKAYDRSPIRAAAMANYFVSILNEINAQLSSEDARNLRIVIENRYLKNVSDLEAAEDSMKAFQQRYGVFSLPDQAKASVQAGAELEAQLMLAQVKLSVLEKQMSVTSPEVQSTTQQIDALTKKINELKTGQTQGSRGDFGVFVPFKQMPGKMMMYLDLYRDVEIQSRLLEYVYPMYEQAKLEEAKETPTVLVLDRAVPPEKKAYPLRALIVLSGAFLGLVLSILFGVFVKNGLQHESSISPLQQKYYRFSLKVAKKLRLQSNS